MNNSLNKKVKPKKTKLKKILTIGGVSLAIIAGALAYSKNKSKTFSYRSNRAEKDIVEQGILTEDFNKKVSDLYNSALENFEIHKDNVQFDKDIETIHKILQRGSF
jgi:hypothetical protein